MTSLIKPSGFIRQLLLFSQFELKRGFTTRKGLLFIATFSVVWYFILLYPLQFTANLLAQDKNIKQNFSFFDVIGFGSLQYWSIPELAVYWQFALVLFPLLSISLAADQTCSDRARGTVRFLLLRSTRDSLFLGRFLGAMAIQAILIIITAFCTYGLMLNRNSNLWASAWSDMMIIIVNLILVVMPFTAMMAALSATVKSARQASLWAVLIWTFLAGIISGLAHYLPAIDFFKLLIPGQQLTALAQLSQWQTFQLAYIPIIQSLLLLALGRWIIKRQVL